jgi:hypothetical protein
MLTKKLVFEPHIIDLVAAMQWEPCNGSFAGTLTCGQLDRDTYQAVNKALEVMGGKWNRKAGAHLFPVDPRSQVEGLLNDGALTVARDGYFPTPLPIGRRMAELANLYPGAIVLEPSAGTGELIAAILEVEPTCQVSAIEKNEQRAQSLANGVKTYRVIGRDFLEHRGEWPRIIQNPPFEEGQDIEHVRHAYDCLTPGGRLVSAMGESAFFREDRKATEFRAWLDGIGGYDVDLPAGAFNESGTGVKARLVVIDRPQPQPVRRVCVVTPEPFIVGGYTQAALWGEK